MFDTSFCIKYQMAQNDLRNIRFPTGWCILCLVCGSKKAVSVSSTTNSLQAKQSIKPRQPSNKNHVLAVTPNLSHSTEPISTAGRSSDVCPDNIPIFFPRKFLSDASLECWPCKKRRMRDCLYSTDAQGEKKQFSTSSEVWWCV